MWFIFPTILLSIGLLGLYLNIRAYKRGGSISLKKLIAIVALILLGGGVFFQKAGIVNNGALEQLLLAFDNETREEKERERIDEQQRKEQEQVEKQIEFNKRINEKMNKLNQK